MDESRLQKIDNRQFSACPLHFLWRGKGSASKLVQFGFATIVLSMGLKTGDRLWPYLGLNTVAAPALMFGGLLWGYGQVKSAWVIFRQK
jgi:hypothetical protein